MQKPEYYDEIQSLCLMDDELMGLCFDGSNEAVEVLVRVILGRDDIRIISSKTQVTLKGVMREVRLDISASDSENRKINVEFQRENPGAVPERARYNSSMIDVNSLKKGGKFTELPEVYVIFITEHDTLGECLPMYRVDRVVLETGKPFNDRSHIIYVNGEHRDSDTALGRLIHDLFCLKSDEMYYPALAERVRYFKENEEGVRKMSRVIDSIIQRKEADIAKSIEEGRASPLIQEALNTRIGIAIELGRRSAREDMEAEIERLMTPKLEKLKKDYDSFLLQQNKFHASLMLKGGKLTCKEIAEYSGLSLSAVERLAKDLEDSHA